MAVVVRAASPPLAPFVERLGYYTGDAPGGWEQMLPTGGWHLLVNLASREFHWREGVTGLTGRIKSGAAFAAAPATQLSLDLSEWPGAVFVCFRPGGAYPFIGRQEHVSRTPLRDVQEVWGTDGALLRDRLLAAPSAEDALLLVEEALLAHAVRPLKQDRAVAIAVAALDRGMPVAEAAALAGVSHSTLLRRFTIQVGLSPKRFARIRRLRQLLTMTAGKHADWACAAAQSGFFDQAHLIAEFRALTGTTPSAYRPRVADPHDPGLLWCRRASPIRANGGRGPW